MADTRSITKVNLYSWLGTILAISLAFTAFFIFQKQKEYESRIQTYQRNNMEYKEDLLVLEVENVMKFLNYHELELDRKLKAAKSAKHREALVRQTKNKVIRDLRLIGFGSKPQGSISIIDSEGNILLSPNQAFHGKKVSELKGVGRKAVFRDIINSSKRRGGGFCEYNTIDPSTNLPSHKTNFSVFFAPWKWIVSSELASSEAKRTFSENVAKLKLALTVEIIFICLIAIVITLLAIRFSFMISKSIKKEMDMLLYYFKESVSGNPELSHEQFQYTELRFIAASAINMVGKIKYLVARIKEMALSAERSSRAKSCYLANMSHEIRNPLNGIMGMTELLKETKLDSAQKEHLTSITASCRSLVALVNGIRDFSATETGHIELNVKDFKLHELMSKTIEYSLPKASGKNIELKSAIDESVPGALSGDPQKIMQVLTTLIENAVFFMQNGVVELNVRCRGRENEKAEILFEVSDNGPGIDSGKLEYIFDFSHEEIATSREFSSISLGFSVCKSIVESLGGSIWVKSEKGSGSTFSFAVPFNVIDGEKEAKAEKVFIETAKPSRKIKALLAEDDPVNQKVESAFLKKAGCVEVEIASDGEQAVEMFKKSSYDIVFMDCEMPKKNGYMATGEIRKIEEETGAERTPIIAMTANALQADIQKSLDAGMDGHAAKPITVEALAEIVQKHTS